MDGDQCVAERGRSSGGYVRNLLWSLLLGLGLAGQPAHADNIETAGNILQYALPISAGIVTVAYTDWYGTLQLGGAMALEGVVVYGLKSTVYETRPNGEGHESFPSGHAAATFAAAEFLRERYGWTYGAPAYALAAFTGYSRIECRAHYWWDVLAGAGIGFLSAEVFTTTYKGWQVSPMKDGKTVGLTLARDW